MTSYNDHNDEDDYEDKHTYITKTFVYKQNANMYVCWYDCIKKLYNHKRKSYYWSVEKIRFIKDLVSK